ncbi:MAG TPA: hypothetical protein VG826_26435 [Pirellulales bacterium]|nr:hypothetical protein [Pirellulales bacterium]
MYEPKLQRCPRCGGELELGFCHRSAPLSFIDLRSVQRWLHVDSDLARKEGSVIAQVADGLRTLLPSKAEYLPSYLCSSCQLYTVDFGVVCSSDEAKGLAAKLVSSHANK